MKAPDKIFISARFRLVNDLRVRENEMDEEYIRKDFLLEWLNERYKSTISNVGCYTGHSVWAEVIEHINEM